MNIKVGEYFKIVSYIINGTMYYFVCKKYNNSLIKAFKNFDDVFEKFTILEFKWDFIYGENGEENIEMVRAVFEL